MSINQAHLIHDHSSGRSSTRLHAPPGGVNSMGTSFGWTEEAPVQKHLQRRDPNASSVFGGPEPSNNNNIQERAPAGSRARKNEFVDNRIGAGVMASNENQNYQQRQPEQQRTGFGDTGASSVKVHHAPGGRSSGNIIGGWN